MKKNLFSKITKTVLSNYDFSLVTLVLFLSAFGLLMIFSASSFRAQYYYGDAYLYIKRQGIFLVGGIVLMIITSLIDYEVYGKKMKLLHVRPVIILYLICLGLHLYVFFAGYSANGSSRWIQLGGGFNLQPSEISKVCFVLGGAFVIDRKKRLINTGRTLKNFLGVIFIFVLSAPILMLVAVQNLSSAVILGGILACLIFVVSRDKKGFLLAMIIPIIVGIFMIYAKGYRSERLTHFLDPETMDSADQIMQGLFAIAYGGLFGRGLGNSVQKLGNMPEVHTDMIFTIICEELGIIGGIAVIGLFLLLLWRIFMIALKAPDLYGALIAIGVFSQVAIQVIMNIAVVTNSMPATGVPLPFISYGGSNLMILMAEMGIVLNVSKKTYTPIPDVEDEE